MQKASWKGEKEPASQFARKETKNSRKKVEKKAQIKEKKGQKEVRKEGN